MGCIGLSSSLDKATLWCISDYDVTINKNNIILMAYRIRDIAFEIRYSVIEGVLTNN